MARTEVQTFRITKGDKDTVKELAKLYGSRSPGEFISEMVSSMISGDPKKAGVFLHRLTQKMGEQLTLDLQAKLEAQKPLRIAKDRKGTKRHAKRS